MKRETKQPNSIDTEIGEQLRQARVVAGWSQSRLARAIGVSYQQIQKYEIGATRVSASRIVLLCDILNVPISDLVRTDLLSAKSLVSRSCVDQEPQSGELVAAFLTIDDHRIRTKVVELVKAMAISYSATGERSV